MFFWGEYKGSFCRSSDTLSHVALPNSSNGLMAEAAEERAALGRAVQGGVVWNGSLVGDLGVERAHPRIHRRKHHASACFSRMRSEGFSFNSGGLGVEPCSRPVVSTSATVRNRPQPFTTVRNRSQ